MTEQVIQCYIKKCKIPMNGGVPWFQFLRFQNCAYKNGPKLMSHTMELWERVIESDLGT